MILMVSNHLLKPPVYPPKIYWFVLVQQVVWVLTKLGHMSLELRPHERCKLPPELDAEAVPQHAGGYVGDDHAPVQRRCNLHCQVGELPWV